MAKIHEVKLFTHGDESQELSERRRAELLMALAAQSSEPGAPADWSRMPITPSYTTAHGLVDMGSQLAGAWMRKEAARADQRAENEQKRERDEALQKLTRKRQVALAAALKGEPMPADEESQAALSKLNEIDQRLQAYQDYLDAGGSEAAANKALEMSEGFDPFKAEPSKFTPESWQSYARTGDPTVLVPRGESSGNAAQAAMLQEYGLYKEQMSERGQEPLDLLSYIRKRNENESSMRLGSSPGLGEFIFDPSRGARTPIRTVSSPEQERDAAAAAAQAQAAAREQGEAAGQRAATLNSDLARFDDEIERTQRLLQEFKSGKYQTGPLAGRLPNFRTSAQELAREQGKDVISAISSATFGALSEGEREFLRNLGVSENASEEANISLLEQRDRELRRARDRLRQQGLSGRAPGSTGLAPGESTMLNGVKVTRKK